MLPGMSEMRRRGAVAACVAVAVVLVGGCSSGGGDDAKAKSTRAASTDAVTSEEVPEDTEPAYPAGPEGDIDRKADEEGWVYDDSLYASASEYVQDMCDSLPVSAKDGASRPQWLAEGGYLADDGEAILKFGVPKLCPKWSKTVKQAASGRYERWLGTGEFEVKAKPAPYDPESDVQEIGPGTYQAKGEFSECYWERTSRSGDIIANQFVTQARVLTVTLRVGELFKNECGTFRPLG
jgi:hypothetical protein